jgi:hypothetical protein
VDDADGNNTTTTPSRGAAAIAAAATASTTDEFGPLPPGWQMSKTDSERAFFIDHINKRTTWVREKRNRKKKFFYSNLFSRSIHELVNQVQYQLHNVKSIRMDHYQ